MARFAIFIAIALSSLLLQACLSKTPVEPIRFFQPVLANTPSKVESTAAEAGPIAAEADPASSMEPTAPGPRLRLRRVQAASHLKERMAWRSAQVEFGFHDQLRWAEKPEVYLERAVTQRLFGSGRAERTESALAATIDLELRAFEEDLDAHQAVVEIHVTAFDSEQDAVLERGFRVTRPIDGLGPDAVAHAIGPALEAATRLATREILAVFAKP